jgi:phage baseplate assembly protein W
LFYLNICKMLSKSQKAHWAIDIGSNAISNPDIYDDDCISQSIETIISTGLGERLFNSSFGSRIPMTLFTSLNETTGRKLLDDVIAAVGRFETRITIYESKCKLYLIPGEHAVIIELVYAIKRTGEVETFTKKLLN